MFYSNDNSHLRLRYYVTGGTCESPAGVTSECLTLELGAGAVHEFRKIRAEDDVYRLTRMRDSFSSYVAVSYTDTSWTVTDSLGRTQTLEFGGPAGEYNRINRVRLSSFGGTEAVYTLRYEFRLVDRPGFDSNFCSLDNDNRVSVPVLTRIVAPDGSFFEMDYYQSSAAPEFLSAGLKSLRLPTGGEYRWAYEKQSYQSQDPGEDRFDRDVQSVWPVVRKEIAETVGGAAIGTLEYESDGHGFVGNGEVNQEKNHRLVYRKTVFHDDSDRFVESTFSDYDGLGNHRQQTSARGGRRPGAPAR